VLGTAISPYLFFWQASQEVEEVRANHGEKPLIASGTCRQVSICSKWTPIPKCPLRKNGSLLGVVETVTTGRLPTMAGIRKADAPIPQEPFPMSEQEFPTHEAAAKAALEECMKKIDAGFAA